LADRTEEHLSLFEEGVEAEFFSTDEEFVDKARYYSDHEQERLKIAEAGRRRCLRSGYSYDDRIRQILSRAGLDKR
jgi:spore maturation protein CgeB